VEHDQAKREIRGLKTDLWEAKEKVRKLEKELIVAKKAATPSAAMGAPPAPTPTTPAMPPTLFPAALGPSPALQSMGGPAFMQAPAAVGPLDSVQAVINLPLNNEEVLMATMDPSVRLAAISGVMVAYKYLASMRPTH
jgi:hypothetical protein